MNSLIKRMGSLFSYIPLPKSQQNVSNCRAELNKFHKKPTGTCVNTNSVNVEYDLQIIVPAYNVEKYIEACIESVLTQDTRYSYIVTVINDGSKDRTEEILKKYQNYKSVECVHQDNKGFSGARNSGLKTLKGKYITFLDSDDLLASDAIEKMLDIAYKTEADIIQGGWHEFGDGHDERKIPGADGIIDDTSVYFSGYPWGKFFKYTVLEQFQFPEGFWFEDTPISYILEALPLKFATLNQVIYEYRINPNGITQTAAFNKKSVDSYWITEQCLCDMPYFNVGYDQRAYDYFMNQVVVNYLRTRRMPRKIREYIFILTSDCIEKYFGNRFSASEKKYYKIEKSLKNKCYLKYALQMLQFR